MQEISDPVELAHLQALLAQWELPPVTAVANLLEDHRVYKISTDGATFTLKDISDAPNVARLEFTRNVLTHVAGAGVSVPLPHRTRTGEEALLADGRYYLLADYIEAGKPPADPAYQAELFYHTGQAIAQLHQALATYPEPEVSSKPWREDFVKGVPQWIAALSEGLPADQAAVVKRVGLTHGDAIVAALAGLPEQLIHRDCHPGNILVQGTEVVGFIDCDHICIGPRLFDLSYYAVHQVKWVTADAVASARWLRDLPHLITGYRSQQSLSPAEVAALPAGMMAYHLLLAHWFMGLPMMEPIALEVESLDWIDRNYATIVKCLIA